MRLRTATPGDIETILEHRVEMFRDMGYRDAQQLRLFEFRRRGIARSIMQELIDWCRSQGFDCVCLHASEEGRPLYEQIAFQPTNEMRLNLLSGGLARKSAQT